MAEEKKQNNVLKIVESAIVSAASSFPIVSSIATGWSEYKNHKQSEHIQNIIIQYAKRLQELSDKVDQDFIGSEEAKRLIERTSTIGKDEIRKKKREMLSEYLANASTKDLSKDTEKDMVLDTIDRISPTQCQLLKSITELLVMQWGKENVKLGSEYDPGASKKPTFGYMIESKLIAINQHYSSKENIEASFNYMESIGVIEVHSARGWTQVGGKTGIKGYRPTKLGLKVLKYLGISVYEMIEIKELIEKNNPK